MRGHRVLLVNPGIYDDFNPLCYPPWGVLWVADSLEAAGHRVRVVDANGPGLESKLQDEMDRFRPTALGITCKLGNGARRARRAIDAANRVAPDVPIVAGGPLVSTFPDLSSVLWQGVDALIIGDGENAVLAWLDDGCRSGLVLGPMVVDMAEARIPTSWSGLGQYVMRREDWREMDGPVLHISAARGCTAGCGFCYNRTHTRDMGFRTLRAEHIVAGLQALELVHGVRGFYFVDDCTVDSRRQHIGKLCELLRELDSPYRLGCSMQLADLEDRQLLAQLYGAGFRYFYVGIESASARVRNVLGKRPASPDVADSLARAIDQGFTLQGSIGIGWPTETAEEMRATLDLINAAPELVFDAYRFLPLPGTPLGLSHMPSSAQDVLARAYQDYSEYGGNYSDTEDEEFGRIWTELCQRQNMRRTNLAMPSE